MSPQYGVQTDLYSRLIFFFFGISRSFSPRNTVWHFHSIFMHRETSGKTKKFSNLYYLYASCFSCWWNLLLCYVLSLVGITLVICINSLLSAWEHDFAKLLSSILTSHFVIKNIQTCHYLPKDNNPMHLFEMLARSGSLIFQMMLADVVLFLTGHTGEIWHYWIISSSTWQSSARHSKTTTNSCRRWPEVHLWSKVQRLEEL